jgi:Family of unknown function (DUF6058)
VTSSKALAGALAEADEAYIRAGFVSLEQLCSGRAESPGDVEALISARRIPRCAYVLDDGTEMFPADHLRCLDEAGGPDAVEAWFRSRLQAAAPELDAGEEWEAYLGGLYGVCLRSARPETIAQKCRLVDAIEALLDQPAVDEEAWRAALRDSVAALDAIERPFAPLDRFRLGVRPSRERLIDDPRARWPAVFQP